MLNISAYYKQDREWLEDTQNDIIVNSVGHYRLITRKKMITNRPEGRGDYQIIYLAGGAGRFMMDEGEQRAHAGDVIVYEPGVAQCYEYSLEDKPDVYWVHFTGGQAGELLRTWGLGCTGIYHAEVSGTFTVCYQNMLQEIQIRREGFMELAVLELKKLGFLSKRSQKEREGMGDSRNREMEAAVRYFHESYQNEISIEDYARSCSRSVCWFIRSFKEYTGMTPQKFITDLRITKARELLLDRSFSVGEVAEITGYSNPLYFSRVFKQYTGIMPSKYGKEEGNR